MEKNAFQQIMQTNSLQYSARATRQSEDISGIPEQALGRSLPRQQSGAIKRKSISRGSRGSSVAEEAVTGQASSNVVNYRQMKNMVLNESPQLATDSYAPKMEPSSQAEPLQLFKDAIQKYPQSENMSTILTTSSPKRVPSQMRGSDGGLEEMKNYIGQVETILHQMKEWVAKKEQLSGSRKSHESEDRLSLSREPALEAARASHRSGIPAPLPPPLVKSNGSSRSRRSKDDRSSRNRKNVFFGKELKSKWEEALVEDHTDPDRKERARSGSNGQRNSEGTFNTYIKDCFMQKLKHNMLPSQSISTLKRSPSYQGTSPNGHAESRSGVSSLALYGGGACAQKQIPVQVQAEEVIDYLTPERSGQLISSESLLYLQGKLPAIIDEEQSTPIKISDLQLTKPKTQQPMKDYLDPGAGERQKDSRRSSRIDSLVYTASKTKSLMRRADLSPEGKGNATNIQDFE